MSGQVSVDCANRLVEGREPRVYEMTRSAVLRAAMPPQCLPTTYQKCKTTRKVVTCRFECKRRAQRGHGRS